MPTEYQLNDERSVILDANGEGWIRSVGPTQYGEEWIIDNTQTRVDVDPVTTPIQSQTRLKIFRNGQSQLVEGTYSGNLDNSNTVFKLRSGETLWYKYENGDAGADARISLSGTRRVKGNRGY